MERVAVEVAEDREGTASGETFHDSTILYASAEEEVFVLVEDCTVRARAVHRTGVAKTSLICPTN